jgi:hypothetical protein
VSPEFQIVPGPPVQVIAMFLLWLLGMGVIAVDTVKLDGKKLAMQQIV